MSPLGKYTKKKLFLSEWLMIEFDVELFFFSFWVKINMTRWTEALFMVNNVTNEIRELIQYKNCGLFFTK